MKNFLFICGTPRSGTTAIRNFLNDDSRIFIGKETFGSKLNQDFGPHLFNKENLVENVKKEIENNQSEIEKLEKSHYVGDKIPLLYLHLPLLENKFRSFKIILMLRNIYDVCNSYENRLRNPNDSWRYTIEDAVNHWNLSLEFIAKNAHRIDMKVILYENFFSSDYQYLENLYTFLKIQPEVNTKTRYDVLIERLNNIEKNRKHILSESQKILISKKANLILYHKIINSNLI